MSGRSTASIARCEEVARLLEGHSPCDFANSSNLVASGEVFGFEGRPVFWVLMFQSEFRDRSIKREPRQAPNDLPREFDGWALRDWFAGPIPCLKDRRLVDLLDSNLSAVSEAARRGRFVATGRKRLRVPYKTRRRFWRASC